VALACDLIEDHARDRDVVAIAGKAERDRCGGLRLTGDIEHQHHRPAGRRRDIGSRAEAPGASRCHAVEQSHHAFGQRHIGVRCSLQQRVEAFATLRP